MIFWIKFGIGLEFDADGVAIGKAALNDMTDSSN